MGTIGWLKSKKMGKSRNFNRRLIRWLTSRLVNPGKKSCKSCKTTLFESRVCLLIFSQCLNASIAIQFTTSSVCKLILMKAS
jgi:hypothetical protein